MFQFRSDGLLVAGLCPSTTLREEDPRRVIQRALVRGDEGVIQVEPDVLVTTDALRDWPSEDLAALGASLLRLSLVVEATTRDENSAKYGWSITIEGLDALREGPWLLRPLRALLDADQEEVFALAEQLPSCTTRSERLVRLGRLQALARRRPDIHLGRLAGKHPVLVADKLRIGKEVASEGALPVPRFAGDDDEWDLEERDLERVARAGLVSPNSQLIGERWVVTQPGAARNALLAVVARRAPQDQRERFLENPTAFLPDDDAFDAADYSARVVGVGEVEIVPAERAESARGWAIPEVGLVLLDTQGAEVLVPAERVAELHEALDSAIREGSPIASYDQAEIPATPALIGAVRRVLDGERPVRDGLGGDEDRRRPLVLLIKENTVVLEWAPAPAAARPIVVRALPSSHVELKPHQLVALEQLQRAWSEGEPGTLLCDDMGLGKTLQALIFAVWVARQVRGGSRSEVDRAERRTVDVPVAIVAPPNLLETWLKELEKRLPASELPVVLWGSADRPSVQARRLVLPFADFVTEGRGREATLEHARIDAERLRLARADVLLISYDQIRRLQFAVGQIRFGVMIADEAQQVKDPSTLRSRALRAMHADFKLAVTGTPIENSWRDLWALCDFALPGQLGTLREFHDAYPSTGDVRVVGEALAGRLRSSLIRRTRAQVLDELPECTMVRSERVMPLEQRQAYDAEQIRHARHGGSGLALLLALSMTSLHSRQRADLTDAAAASEWAAESARTQVLWEALHRYRAEGAAALVFVRSLAMQKTLKRAIELAFDLPPVGVLNGESGTIGQRYRTVRDLEEEHGFRVLLVSPDVGGAGWNLQFATRAVLLERTWNPAKEAQMIARIHRLGQTQPVEVVTPLAVQEGRRTFDTILDELLTDKRELSQSVLAPSEVTDAEVAARFAELYRTVEDGSAP